MKIEFNITKIQKVLSDFCALTKLSISMYDAEYTCLAYSKPIEVSTSPERTYINSSSDNGEISNYCRLMQSSPKAYLSCELCDRKMFLQAAQTKKPVVYTCHAGVVESVYPILCDDIVVGYFMLGKYLDKCPSSSSAENIIEIAKKFDISYTSLFAAYNKLPVLSEKQTQAAMNVLSLFVSYFLLTNLIQRETDHLSQTIKNYILNNLEFLPCIEDISAKFLISPNKLYSIFRSEFNMTVKQFVLNARINKAKSLLKNSDLPISDISVAVGFSDYNYFIRIFKKHTSVSPLQYRKSSQQ